MPFSYILFQLQLCDTLSNIIAITNVHNNDTMLLIPTTKLQLNPLSLHNICSNEFLIDPQNPTIIKVIIPIKVDAVFVAAVIDASKKEQQQTNPKPVITKAIPMVCINDKVFFSNIMRNKAENSN
eukprot:745177_1